MAAAAVDPPKKDPWAKPLYDIKTAYPPGVPAHAYQCFKTIELSQKAGGRQYNVQLARGDIDDGFKVFKVNQIKGGNEIEVYHLNPPKPPRRMRYYTNGFDSSQEFYWFDDEGLRSENAKLKNEVKTIQQQRTEAVVEKHNNSALRLSKGEAHKRKLKELRELKTKVKELQNTDAIDRAALSAKSEGGGGGGTDDKSDAIDAAAGVSEDGGGGGGSAAAVASPEDDDDGSSEPLRKRTTQPRAKLPCFAFVKSGSCTRGDQCTYSHDPKVKSEDMTQHMCGFIRYGICEKKGCLMKHDVPTGPRFDEWVKNTKNRPNHCHEYFKYGDCRYGGKCKWKHDRPPFVPLIPRPAVPISAEAAEFERIQAEKPEVSRFATIPDSKSNRPTLRRLVQ